MAKVNEQAVNGEGEIKLEVLDISNRAGQLLVNIRRGTQTGYYDKTGVSYLITQYQGKCDVSRLLVVYNQQKYMASLFEHDLVERRS